MTALDLRKEFEQTKKIYESKKLTFHGVEGFDVYNPSVPFVWQGKYYMFGRVERRGEWARSFVKLFTRVADDEWTLVPNSMVYQLEDPFVTTFGDTLLLGGTHVRYQQGRVDTYYDYFYKGTDLHDLYYYTTGPDYMKDIRLVQMPDHRIGVFSRPRSEEIRRKYGSESLVGFTVINGLEELTAERVENAKVLPDIFGKDEWGGCNQAFYLDSGKLGVIGHLCYLEESTAVSVYMNTAFVFDPENFTVQNLHIIGTRSCYPAGPAKTPKLVDCTFTSGIEMRSDGLVNLYSGIGDCEVGRIVIDYPFAGYGSIVY